MARLTKEIIKAWDDRKGPVILTTVDKNGVPNAIYATCVTKFDDETLVVADNFFDKTQKNIFDGSIGSILFITNDDKAYQVKGKIEYLQDGEIFDDMKTWNGEHPGHAAAALKVQEVYSGAEKLL
ncbi:MAG: pyridoxamine 5'-phosphate oxidase family protein [Verrucomicrobiota bacterium]|nr:pyridoxamine 5'-phosphate oxidase family protein [Verrucomicrobiota bacterium]